jgi:predicted transcriptional regulator
MGSLKKAAPPKKKTKEQELKLTVKRLEEKIKELETENSILVLENQRYKIVKDGIIGAGSVRNSKA